MKLIVKPIVNKANGQVNISLRKKELPKKFLKDLDKIHELEIKFNKWS